MCQQKKELLSTYSDALKALLGHLRLQTDAIGAGDADYGRFDCLIEAAEQRKRAALQAYTAHVSHHACGFPLQLGIESDHGRMHRFTNVAADDASVAEPPRLQVPPVEGEPGIISFGYHRGYREIMGQESQWVTTELHG